MENEFGQKKNIFKATFDSFELDDGFLMKVDADLRKNEALEKCKRKEFIQKEKEKKTPEVKSTTYFDLPLCLDDFNESDFFDFGAKKSQKAFSKGTRKGEKIKKPSEEKFISCVSPIHGPLSSKRERSLSSTPLKLNDSTTPDKSFKSNDNVIEKKSPQKGNGNTAKMSEFLYMEADLFEDWGEEIKMENTQKNRSSITLSQAFEMIEKAESEQKEAFNQSIDLLTGEVVDSEIGPLFEESFNKLKSAEKKKLEENDCMIINEKSNSRIKPQAAQKLNFGHENVGQKNSVNICFSSDDELDFFVGSLLDKPKELSPYPLKEDSPRESSDVSINFGVKRGKRKCLKIVDSESAEDSPSPKFFRRMKRKTRREVQRSKNFIDFEAEVSEEVEVSSDEVEEEGDYEKSFLDENSYLTQNCSADMTAKYLESVKSFNRAGSFKIPASKPYNPAQIFSQIPEESNIDYEIDSFCVYDVEEEQKTDLSDLEVAEKILEMDRKKRKKKSGKS